MSNWPTMSVDEANNILTASGMQGEVIEIEICGVLTKTWKNAPATLRTVVERARLHADKTFLVYQNERATFEEFYMAVSKLSHQFVAQGVVKGDRIAIIMRNLIEWPVAFYAAVSIGAIATPLNAWLTAPELEFALKDSGAKIAIVDEERYDLIKGVIDSCAELVNVYVTGDRISVGCSKVTKLYDIIGSSYSWASLPDRDLPAVDLQPEDYATIFYTSGTTGTPKGALGTHRNFNSAVISSSVAMQRAQLRNGEFLQLPLENFQQPTVLLPIPLFHVAASVGTMNGYLYNGGKIVLMRRWDTARAFELIEREKVTLAGGVPTQVWQMIEHPLRGNYDLSTVNVISYGGAAAPAELVRRLHEAFPNATPATGWGMTETSTGGTSIAGEDYFRKPDSCGPALPVADLKIMDPDGVQKMPVGEVGELWCKGPTVVRGYWNAPEATAAAFVDSWVRTGDIARCDEDGFYYIVDRMKDMLIRGGENIYCIEIENALYEHTSVMDAAVIGIPHRTLGEEPAAIVTLIPGTIACEDDLRSHLAERLAAFKIPVRIKFSNEILPRNANGKILKHRLKEFFEYSEERSVNPDCP